MKNKNIDIVNVDNEGNVITEAFPVSQRTVKDHRKTSVGYTVIAVLLHILAFAPIIAVSIVLAVKCYNLMPYYTFWPFVGLIITIVFGLIFLAVSLIVTRKRSKSGIMGQTVKIAITFVCLTSVFALIVTYVLPDIISMATQNTLFAEDVYNNGAEQAEINAKLERDFIRYNILNGNLNKHGEENGDFSYTTLSKREEDQVGGFLYYHNDEIQANFDAYSSYDIRTLERDVIEVMKKSKPLKYELYDFIYNSYVLNDFDYALVNTIGRRAFALSLVDYEYKYSGYEKLLKEGFSNKKIKQLFDKNFDSFNHDGYQTFDDPLLLFAQMEGRMTVPVVLRLILNEGWQSSQGSYDLDSNLYYADDGNFLYELYDPETRDAFIKDGGIFDREGTRINGDGKEIKDKYGYNKEGWKVYESGVVERPMKWLVLDMLGDPMDVASVDINSALGGLLGSILPDVSPNMVGSFLAGLLSKLGGVVDAVGGLLQDDVGGLIQDVTGGANLNLSICIDDSGALSISITPMNAQYGMLGYMQASWVQSDNLLMAVINVLGLRNWLCIFGAVGIVLVIAAGILRECGKNTRLRTAVARDRIMRANTAEKIASGELEPTASDEMDILREELTPSEVAAIEKERGASTRRFGKKSAEETDENVAAQIDETVVPVAAVEEKPTVSNVNAQATAVTAIPVAQPVTYAQTSEPPIEEEPEQEPAAEKRGLFGRKKKKDAEEAQADVQETTADLFPEAEEEPVQTRKGLFGRKKKEEFDDLDSQPTADVNSDGDFAEEPVQEKKGLFGKKKKKGSDDFAEEVVADSAEEEFIEEPAAKKGLFGRKKKKEEIDEFAEESAADIASDDEFAEDEPVKEKKSLFGRKKKKNDDLDFLAEEEESKSDELTDLF